MRAAKDRGAAGGKALLLTIGASDVIGKASDAANGAAATLPDRPNSRKQMPIMLKFSTN